MFDFLKKKPKGTAITLNIEGMHCPSCALAIDGELEDIAGVISAKTNYARSQTTVEYDPEKVAVSKLKEAVQRAGYAVRS